MDLIIDRMRHVHDIVANVLDVCHDKPLKLTRNPAFSTIMNALESAIDMVPPSQVNFQLPDPRRTDLDSFDIACNPVSMVQIFTNLIKNAVHAMDGRGIIKIMIEDEIMDEYESSRMVAVRIIDSGIGIDSQTIDKIFDPFFTIKDVSEGTDIGLFAVKRLMMRQNGHVSVESIVGQGSIFTVILPLLSGQRDGETES